MRAASPKIHLLAKAESLTGCGSVVQGFRNRLPGSEAERLRMGSPVMLGQDLTEVAGPVRDSAVTDVAAGDRQLGNGHREAAGR